jgi:tRNA(Ile2) C34 agmatinyltransferase TiaS
MDATRCPRCDKRMIAVSTAFGRTDLKCLQCDKRDPLKTDAVKCANSPLVSPAKAVDGSSPSLRGR